MTTTIEEIAKILIEKNLKVATTESCTGGLLSSKFTDISGSSAFVHLNLVTYANSAKHEMLGVRNETLENYGAVSEECAYEMASGLMKLTGADICISTTGIAGPTGGSANKPVGLMYVAIKSRYKSVVREFRLNPKLKRTKMKYKFTQCALEMLLDFLSDNVNG